MNIILSVIGIVGGILCAIADMLLDIKGKDNKKCGSNKILDSNWEKMPNWRFISSSIIAMFAVPMYSMGIISLGNQISIHNEITGYILKLSIFIGAMGGFFIHTFICVIPIIYKEIMKNNNFELADRTISKAFKVVKIPFFVLYLVLMLVPTIIVCYTIIMKFLNVPIWFVFLNPVIFQIIGWILRAIKKEWFYEVPSICAASLGLAMFGVIGIVNLI
ncbi:hypothetical protein JYG23_07950 [Sedimentibacter sp. zth1]|uniref:DUF6796 family protein n=1 Tax=Sedimentibacter sp. zth1 TaxID=2816908 RepID=UPI001A9105E4|nr:DUF6796 family protein [Sedimentibacter sp. zth1]QSX04640.1 hypothetical protein JYG23_07950 [Sedimentibacter sp. zth1]